MAHKLDIELSDRVYAAIQRQAKKAGTSPACVAAQSLEQHFLSRQSSRMDPEREAGRRRFDGHFGEVDLGRASGADNTAINADLARAYSDIEARG